MDKRKAQGVLKTIIAISAIAVAAGLFSTARAGEFAPKDAFLDGSEHPYYGSITKWDQRFFESHTSDHYKRRGQHQMLDILQGRESEAVKYCLSLLESDPNDSESLFNLTLARCRIGDIDAALESMKRAVDAGLPFGRFLAGPRQLTRPLVETSRFKEYAAKQNVQLIHGPMLGCVTDNSARFWVRAFNEVPVQVVVGTTKELRTAIKSQVKHTDSKNDYTAIVEVKELRPDTKYFYEVRLNKKEAAGHFRTYPKTGEKAHFKVGFGGGAGYTAANERMWDAIASHKPLAFLLLGDNVYIDLPQEYGKFHRYTYYRRQSRPEFRRLVGSASIYAIWDDHDCAINDVWMGPYRDKPAWKMSMMDGFRMNWNNPGYGDPQWPACWFNFSIGDVDFFMLDGRFYRTNPHDKNPTMLGPVQKKWLFEQLKNSKAAFKVLASPVPWSFNTKGDSLDTWNGFRDERNEIFDFLAINEIEGVILISADRHRSDARRIDRKNGYALYEFESSRLTNQHVHKLMPGAIFGYNKKQSFGLLSFDTTRSDPTVTFRIVSVDNEVVHSLTLKRSEISH